MTKLFGIFKRFKELEDQVISKNKEIESLKRQVESIEKDIKCTFRMIRELESQLNKLPNDSRSIG